MNCERFDEHAELYVLGELAPELVGEADAHLADCPACCQRAEAARRQLGALQSALASHRASDGFAERTMARVRAEAAPAEAKAEPLRRRVLRYAALAAAAALLAAMAGYGILRGGSMAWLESGSVAVAGPPARQLGAASPLAPGDVLATPAGGSATLALAGGRLRVAMAPLTVVRIMDPRTGTALQVVSGEVYCRGSGGGSAPMVACPLANVAAGPGVVSLHVTPEHAPPGGTEGTMVTLAAHDGAARVIVQGQGAGAVPLERGQVLTLSTDRRRRLSAPVPIERLRELLGAERRAVMARHGELELRWEALLGGPGEGPPLFRRAGELQEALSQTRALHGELERRLQFLDRCQAEGQRVLRVVLRPVTR